MAERIAIVQMPDGTTREARVMMPDEPVQEAHPEAKMSAATPGTGLSVDEPMMGTPPMMGGAGMTRMAGTAAQAGKRMLGGPVAGAALGGLAGYQTGGVPGAIIGALGGRMAGRLGRGMIRTQAAPAAEEASRIIQPSADMIGRIKDPQEIVRIMKASGASAHEIARVLKQAGIDLASSAWK
jgi:hypothetical protein